CVVLFLPFALTCPTDRCRTSDANCRQHAGDGKTAIVPGCTLGGLGVAGRIGKLLCRCHNEGGVPAGLSCTTQMSVSATKHFHLPVALKPANKRRSLSVSAPADRLSPS